MQVWYSQVLNELKDKDIEFNNLKELEELARDRSKWREIVAKFNSTVM